MFLLFYRVVTKFIIFTLFILFVTAFTSKLKAVVKVEYQEAEWLDYFGVRNKWGISYLERNELTIKHLRRVLVFTSVFMGRSGVFKGLVFDIEVPPKSTQDKSQVASNHVMKKGEELYWNKKNAGDVYGFLIDMFREYPYLMHMCFKTIVTSEDFEQVAQWYDSLRKPERKSQPVNSLKLLKALLPDDLDDSKANDDSLTQSLGSILHKHSDRENQQSGDRCDVDNYDVKELGEQDHPGTLVINMSVCQLDVVFNKPDMDGETKFKMLKKIMSTLYLGYNFNKLNENKGVRISDLMAKLSRKCKNIETAVEDEKRLAKYQKFFSSNEGGMYLSSDDLNLINDFYGYFCFNRDGCLREGKCNKHPLCKLGDKWNKKYFRTATAAAGFVYSGREHYMVNKLDKKIESNEDEKKISAKASRDHGAALAVKSGVVLTAALTFLKHGQQNGVTPGTSSGGGYSGGFNKGSAGSSPGHWQIVGTSAGKRSGSSNDSSKKVSQQRKAELMRRENERRVNDERIRRAQIAVNYMKNRDRPKNARGGPGKSWP